MHTLISTTSRVATQCTCLTWRHRKKGTERETPELVLKLAKALTEPVKVITYGQFPAMMEIDSARNVSVDAP